MFRPDIQYTMVYWEHGYWPSLEDDETRDAFFAHHKQLALYLLRAEVIGLETTTSTRDGVTVEQEFAEVSAKFANGKLPRVTTVRSGTEFQLLGLARGLKEAGRKDMPRFVPLDAYADKTLAARMAAEEGATTSSETEMEKAQTKASILHDREEHVIRQLRALGQQLPEDGAMHYIADIHGSIHTPVAIALRALGANVRVIHVEPPVVSATAYLQRLLRFGAISTSEAETLVSSFTAAEHFSFRTWMEAVHMQKITSTNGSAMGGVDVLGQLSMLHLRGDTNSLPPKLQGDWDELRLNRPDGFDREARSIWLDRVLALARLATRF